MKDISDYAVAFIKHFEGFSANPYRCAGGYQTIGYGHVITVGEKWNAPITKAAAEKLLVKDILIAVAHVKWLIHVPLVPHQLDALTSFTFNLGAGALQRSTLRRKLNRAEYNLAAAEFPRWVFAGGKRLRGLVIRRQGEAALFSEKPRLIFEGTI